MKLSPLQRSKVERLRVAPEDGEIILYVRLSTQEQAINSNALSNQIARGKERDPSLLIIDIESGRKSNRSGLKVLIQLAQQNKVKTVIVTRLDRLGRTVPIIRSNIKILQDNGVHLICIDQNLDFATPEGMLMVNLLASVAEMEVEQTANRIRSVKAYRREKKYACDYAPFGYIVEENQYRLNHSPYLCLLDSRPADYRELYEVDALEELPGLTVGQIARDCIQLFLDKKGITPAVRAIAQKYGLGFTVAKRYGGNQVLYWSGPGLKKWMLNHVLRGHTVYKKHRQLEDGRRKARPPEEWTIIDNTHPNERLLSDGEFEDISQILAFNSKRMGMNLYNYDQSKAEAYGEYAYQRRLIYCDRCHGRCSATSRHGKNGENIYYYYYCRNRHRGCGNRKGTRRDLIEQRLIEVLLQQSSTPTPVAPPQQKNTIQSNPLLQVKLKSLEDKLEKLEAIEGYDINIENAKTETRKQIEQVKKPFEPDNLKGKTVKELIGTGNSLLLWHSLSSDEKVEIYPRLIEHITIDQGQVVSVVLKDADEIGMMESLDNLLKEAS